MGRSKKPKDNADDWYQKALRDDPDGADELKRKRREAEQARRDQAKARKRLRLLQPASVGDGGGLVGGGLGAAGWVVAGWVVAGRRRQRRLRPGGGGLGSSESVGCCLCHVKGRKRSYSREVWGCMEDW